MNELIKTISWSAPISAVLTTAVIWLLRKWIADRLTSSIRHEYDTALESHKAALKAQLDAELELHKGSIQREFHVYQSQFDMEFRSFQELWKAVSSLVDKTVRILKLYDYVEREEGKGEKKNYADQADATYFSTIATVQEHRPFIPEDTHELARDLSATCKEEIDYFYRAIKWEAAGEPSYDQNEARKRAQSTVLEIERLWDRLADAIRNRLSSA